MAIDYNIKRTVRERVEEGERERENKIRSIKIKLKFQSESRKKFIFFAEFYIQLFNIFYCSVW